MVGIFREQTMSAALLGLLLGLTGATMFVWMASNGWQDIHGIILGVIFIILSVAQSAFLVCWYRTAMKDNDKEVDPSTEGKELTDMHQYPIKGSDGANSVREAESPLLAKRSTAYAVHEVPSNQVHAHSGASA